MYARAVKASRSLFIEQRLSPETLSKIDEIETLMTESRSDAFGFTPEQLKWTLPFVAFIYEYYFRVQTVGIENIPSGRVLLIANHSGQVPLDGVMIEPGYFLKASHQDRLGQWWSGGYHHCLT